MNSTTNLIGNRFKIGKCIGSGAFGEIYLSVYFLVIIGIDTETGKDVAIKTVRYKVKV